MILRVNRNDKKVLKINPNLYNITNDIFVYKHVPEIKISNYEIA